MRAPTTMPALNTGSTSLTIKAGHARGTLAGCPQGRPNLHAAGHPRERPHCIPTTGSRSSYQGPDRRRFVKELHAGDPDFYLPYRPARDGQGQVSAREKAERRAIRPYPFASSGGS